MVTTEGYNLNWPPGHHDDAEKLRRSMSTGRIGGFKSDIEAAGSCPQMFREDTDLPMYDSDLDAPTKYVVAEACVEPIAAVTWQYIASNTNSPEIVTIKQFLAQPERRFREDERAVEMLENVAAAADGTAEPFIPAPFIEVDENRNIRPFQEGRHRSVAAWILGFDLMPHYVFMNPDKSDGNVSPSVSAQPVFVREQLKDMMGDLREQYAVRPVSTRR